MRPFASDDKNGPVALIESILANPEQLAARSEAGRRQVAEHYTWSAKAAKVRAVYDWVLGPGGSPPDLSRVSLKT